jgi:hypothetical protein
MGAPPRRAYPRLRRPDGNRPRGNDEPHAGGPTSTKISLEQKVNARAKERWPQLSGVQVRHRAQFPCPDAVLPDGDVLPLRYLGSAHQWGFATYRASHNDYEASLTPEPGERMIGGGPLGRCGSARRPGRSGGRALSWVISDN